MESSDTLMEEKKLMSEGKYRNYMSNIDKALRNFEYSSEWADLISALGKLSKAISGNTQYQVIPRRIKISKRLAQCMHPALPSGVHLKALETYSVIFSKTGPERLATELFIYSAGLFPLLGYAAMNVRTALLGVYETYFVPLGEKLRPALGGFLCGVLPGYECGLDHFDRTSSLLTQVCRAVNPTYFYTVLWECVATNAAIRLPAITYILDHFNKKVGTQQQMFVMGHHHEIMMSGLCACLNDTMVLVQRNTLEFLLLCFPMHTEYLSREDFIKLLTNGLNTILRRDMSLNRRLYAWILGTEICKNSPTYDTASLDGMPAEEKQESYFEKHSKEIVIQSLICALKFSLDCDPVDLKPYRIMVSLVDKREIGTAVLDDVLCDIIRAMSLSNGNVEVVKSANLLFATFEPAYIWSYMTNLFEKACKKADNCDCDKTKHTASQDGKFRCEVGSGDPLPVEICYLTEYLLETISLETYNETTRIYLPKVFLAITQMLTIHMEHISHEEVTAALKLCMKIVSRVQPMITSPIKVMPRPNQGYSSSDERAAKALLSNEDKSALNTLEKSKSDSKLNQFSTEHSIALEPKTEYPSREGQSARSSIRPIERKSPKKKKAKSYSKLSELDKEICPITGKLIDPTHSSSDLDSPLSIKKLKSKAKPAYMRIRTSPKKSRPKNIEIPSMESQEPKSLDPVLLQKATEANAPPLSAPHEKLNKEHLNEFIFDYQEAATSADEEFSILEKCICQYEIFFEIYLARKILQIESPSPAIHVKVRVQRDPDTETDTDSVNKRQAGAGVEAVADAANCRDSQNFFECEEVFDNICIERLMEIEKMFETLRVSVINRTLQLQSLLRCSLSNAADSTSDGEYQECLSDPEKLDMYTQKPNFSVDTEQKIQALIELRLQDETLRNAIKLAANLLVEMSTFPNCKKTIILDKTEKELPSWLKVLCLVAAYTLGDKELQLCAITTLFDLISLLKSQIEYTSTSPGVTFVVMLPLLKFGHVKFIEHKTRLFQLLTSLLWNYLGDAEVDPATITALLYQLHNCLESGLVEAIIGNRMYASDMQQHFAAANALASPAQSALLRTFDDYRRERAAEVQLICVSPMPMHLGTSSSTQLRQIKQLEQLQQLEQMRESEAMSLRKFELLWHLGRDKQPSKGFERTLLKVLDTLTLPHYNDARTFVARWLQAALLRGDLSRLLKPLYKILLANSSKRIAITHLLHSKLNPQEGALGNTALNENRSNASGVRGAGGGSISGGLERSVYAISSEFGNIKYHHLNGSVAKKRSPIRSFHKKIFGVTLSSKNKTANFVSDKTAGTEVAPADATIGLIINPLDNSPDFGVSVSVSEDADADADADVDVDVTAAAPSEHEGECEIEVDLEGEEEAEGEEEPPNDDQDFTDNESDSSIFDSESENRDTSVEKDTESLALSPSGELKRFVGDCECVTDALTQHERTKNRKTYHLRHAHAGSPSLGLTGTGNEDAAAQHDDETAHPADEYFNVSTSNEDTKSAGTVETFVRDLLEQVNATAANATIVTTATTTATVTQTTTTTTTIDLVGGSPQKKKRLRRLQMTRKKKFNNSSPGGAAATGGNLKKSSSASDKKRMSCISKTSTDSNNSAFDMETSGTQSLHEEQATTISVHSDEEGGVTATITSTSTATSTATATATAATTATINVEEKRRNLSLQTKANRGDKSEWELTAETLEKSKQNLQILRESAAHSQSQSQSQSGSSQRSSTKSANSAQRLLLERPHRSPHYFYTHMLIYAGVYDTQQTLYAFQTLRNIIASDTRTFLCLSITTSLASSSLRQLLIRHRKSIAGKGFAGNVNNSEFAQHYRGCMHLEVLVTICLYFARGFFAGDSEERGSNSNSNSSTETPTPDDVLGNCRVQLQSVELLTLICSELIEIVKSMGKGLACYIADLMARCKLQKTLLHCLNASVNAYGSQEAMSPNAGTAMALAEHIVRFNQLPDGQLHAESLQTQLLRLMMALIKLEYEVQQLKQEASNPNNSSSSALANPSAASAVSDQASVVDSGNISPTRFSSMATDGGANGGAHGSAGASATSNATMNVKYLPNCPISQQPMFLAAVLGALQDERLRHLHRNWTDLVTASLHCFGMGSLTNIVISVVHQLCNNVDRIAKQPLRDQCTLPPDYVVSQLEAITILCHFCLLDNTQQTTLSHLSNQAYPQTSVAAPNSSSGQQLLNSIVHSLLSSAASSAQQEPMPASRNPQLLAARNAVLSHLSRIVSTVAAIWDSELGQVRQVRQQLLEFLSPVSLHHGANFLAAVAVTWQQRAEQHRRKVAASAPEAVISVVEQYQRNASLQACADQLSLVQLVSCIRVMPMDSFVQTLQQVVRTPPPIHRPPVHLAIEVSALELFYFYMRAAPAPQLGDSWSAVLALLRDGLALPPPAQFALLMLLNEFVQRCPQMPFQDKKDMRDLHDITSRLVESLASIAGSCLEQTTWLRRNLAVKEDIPTMSADGQQRDNNLGGLQQYSVQAQSVLASILANLLDVAYGSQEKDKVVTLITTLMYNITPYLKNHTPRNVPSFYACSSLMASLSSFQYTRKAWRKDMFDLLLDPAFFQMDRTCLPFWKQIMDSLMTYDNTTFRELMSRVSLTQTGSLNIFSSREQEYEQRTMLLKRLAFVIYCSEFDQYNKYIPEIQEQLANSLRLLSMVPSVQAAVFLCFRVLLLRMSPDHVTSLWPIIIAEMVQVFLSMEQELKSDVDDLSQQMRLLSGMEVSWTSSNTFNGITSQHHLMHWRAVQLEAAKLLELGCVLPATSLPHFQMYRWAFVGTEFDAHEEVPIPIPNGSMDAEYTTATLPTSTYVPHVRRIARLMDMKYTTHSPSNNLKRGQHLVLTCQQISSLQDLYGFFSTLIVNCPNPSNYAETDKNLTHCMNEIEEVLANDFLERMPTSTTPR